MKEHNQGLCCNIEIFWRFFSKKIRIISRIYNRWPPKKKKIPIFFVFKRQKCSGREKKLDATGSNDGSHKMDRSPAIRELSWITSWQKTATQKIIKVKLLYKN
jgi:hypothetical protein